MPEVVSFALSQSRFCPDHHEGEYWTQKAHGVSDNRGKQLRRDGFSFAEERYAEYKPILEEVEKILAEAGLDEDEMRAGAAQTGGGGGAVSSRNRR